MSAKVGMNINNCKTKAELMIKINGLSQRSGNTFPLSSGQLIQYIFDFKNYFPKNLNAAPQKPPNQLNFRSNFSSTCTENSNISLLMIKNLSI
jgi:hypothetical protein